MDDLAQRTTESELAGPVFTVGYEGRSPDELFRLLVAAGITVLVDSRWRPQSRKAGFSKSALQRECARRGIEYRHERDLGTPPEIMRRFRETGDYDWDAYQAFLRSKASTVDSIAGVARTASICFLCYELDAAQCHRRFVAQEVAARLEGTVRHLS
jgi:uncharacterized protein (DUF488 family)